MDDPRLNPTTVSHPQVLDWFAANEDLKAGSERHADDQVEVRVWVEQQPDRDPDTDESGSFEKPSRP